MSKFKMLILLALIASVMAACAPAVSAAEEPTPTVTEEPVASVAVVEDIEVHFLESLPVQVQIVVRGTLPDAGCTTIGSVEQELEGDTFKVKLITTTDPLALCAQALTPFEEVVKLEFSDLPVGDYVVDVNGVQETFTYPS